MQRMTRPELHAHEKSVEAALSSVEQSLDEAERARFQEISAAARDVAGACDFAGDARARPRVVRRGRSRGSAPRRHRA